MSAVHEMSGGGGWRGSGNNGGPWGQGPRNTGGGGGSPPDLEEILRRGQDRLRRVFPRRSGGGSGINPLYIVLIVIVVLAVVAYNFFTFRVEPDQQGVVLRFGEFNRQVGPGLNFRMPAPIETVYTPSVQRVNQVTVGRGADGRVVSDESLMLTADGNIVDIAFSVSWRVRDPREYLFNLRNPDTTVKAVAESAMRELVGRSQLTPLLGEERESIGPQALALMQAILDEYGAGIIVSNIQVINVSVPPDVLPAFDDVVAAGLNQITVQNDARAYANRIVPEARGEAARIVQTANAYREQTVAQARGQADRFLQIYAAYREAPEVTRQRIYLETIANLLAATNKIILPTDLGADVLPYLPLPALGNATPGAR